MPEASARTRRQGNLVGRSNLVRRALGEFVPPNYALDVDPPLGRVGLSETEAARTGHHLLVSKSPMTRVGRAVERDETKGFMKVVADAQTKQILGAAILRVGGGEAIHGILDMMNVGATYPVLQWAMPIHPTVSALIPTVLGD